MDGARGLALEASVVEVFARDNAYVFNRQGPKGTVCLKFHARQWTVLLHEDMAKKVASLKNVTHVSTEQQEQMAKLGTADTKGMRGRIQNRMRIATMSMRTLRGNMALIIDSLNEQEIDLMALQVTRLSNELEPAAKSWAERKDHSFLAEQV